MIRMFNPWNEKITGSPRCTIGRHREGAKAAWARSTVEVNGQRYLWRTAGGPLNPYAGGKTPEYPMLGEGDSCPVDHSKADCPWHRTKGGQS